MKVTVYFENDKGEHELDVEVEMDGFDVINVAAEFEGKLYDGEKELAVLLGERGVEDVMISAEGIAREERESEYDRYEAEREDAWERAQEDRYDAMREDFYERCDWE